jgi:hypothetical protein
VHLVGWSHRSFACYAAIDQAGPQLVDSLTVIDETPKPLATGAPDEWAEMDLKGFLEELSRPRGG